MGRDLRSTLWNCNRFKAGLSENRILAFILALFIFLGITYGVVTPVFEASDELWHYPMIRHLADGNPLPVQAFDPALAGPWKQEASQPPLYYYLGAALTFWIDTSDMTRVRWENPHVDNGVITADGNNNLVIHDPAVTPWQGTLLAVYIVRIFSVFLGAATVYLTFLIAREVAPDRPEISLGSAAVTAFIPMFLFISGAVNNDNLIVPLSALALWLMIRLVGGGWLAARREREVGYWLLLGVVIGLAALTKITGVGLLALAWGTAFVTRWQANSRLTWPALVRWLVQATWRWLWVLLPVLLIAGWWYYRNVVLYGDWKGWNAFIAVLGQRGHDASLAQLWGERWGFMLSYWGLFGGVNIPMSLWIYRLLNGVVVVSLLGFAVYVVQETRKWRLADILKSPMPNLLSFVAQRFPLILCLLWSAAVVLGLISWATTTWSSQGRLVFSALPALTTLMIVGLVGWLPRRPATWIVSALAGFMLAIAVAAPFAWIRPAYQPPDIAPTLAQRAAVNFGDALQLVGYEVDKTIVLPGETLAVRLEWEVLAPMDRDWSVFVHLNDPVLGRPIAQRDMYPGQGLLATRLLQPGQRLVNNYLLQVPATAVAPADLELTVGLYDYYTCPQCQRLPVLNASLPTIQDAVMLAVLPLTSMPGQYPNPLQVNFAHQLELAGFNVTPRRAHPGATLTVTLYWRTRRPLVADYTFFAQVVDEDTTRWASQDLPVNTSSWAAGEVQSVTMSLTLAEDTPADVYPIHLGMYTLSADGAFNRLQRVAEDGRLTDNFLILTQVRVD